MEIRILGLRLEINLYVLGGLALWGLLAWFSGC